MIVAEGKMGLCSVAFAWLLQWGRNLIVAEGVYPRVR